MDQSLLENNIYLYSLIIAATMSFAVIITSVLILILFSLGNKEDFKEIKNKILFIDAVTIVSIFIIIGIMTLGNTIINNFGILWLVGIIGAALIIVITLLIYKLIE